MHIDEIGPYGINYVKSKAWFLIKKCGFARERFEDLEQDMLLDLVERLPRHDPAKSPRNAFITRIVKNKVVDIITERDMPSREHFQNEVSLNKPVVRDGRPTELGDLLTVGEGTESPADLKADLARALQRLPEDLRLLWDLKVQGLSLTEIAMRSGVSRPTMSERWAKVIRHLREMGLEQYFQKP